MASLFESIGVADPADIAPLPPAPEPRGAVGVAKDAGISLLKGAIDVPEAAVGLADLVTGGHAGKAAEAAGFRPKEAKAILDENYTPEQKAAFQRVQAANGFGDTLIEAIRNPSVVAHSVLESLPSMGAGGVVGRGAVALAPRLVTPVLGGAIGEGAVQAGQAGEQIRQDNPDGLLTPKQAAIAAASGLIDTGISALGGKIAQRLGISDVDTLLAGAKANPTVAKGLTRRVLEGMASEGILEELPQSIQEQVLQNAAQNKPLDDGVDQSAVLGMLSGMAMGGGANMLHGEHQPVPHVEPVPVTGPLSRAANANPGVAAAGGLDVGIPASPDAAEQAGASTAPAQPPAVDPVLERIKTLEGSDRAEALAAYNLLSRDDTPKGVRQYNSKLLDDLLAKLEPQEPGAAPVESSDPAALLSQGMNADPLQQALASRRDEQTAQANLATWMQRAAPLPLEQAQGIQEAGAARGYDLSVVPHSAGQGFTVIPSEWVTPAMRSQVATAIPMDAAPTGVLRADAQGNVAPETRVQAIDTQQAADAAAAERARKDALGLTPDVEAVQAGVKRAPLPIAQAGDVTLKSGEPFKNKGAAMRAQAKTGAGAVLQVQGGWVVRTQPTQEVSDVRDAGATGSVASAPAGQLGGERGGSGSHADVPGRGTGGGSDAVSAGPAASGEAGHAVRAGAGEQAAGVAPAAPKEQTAPGGERWSAADAPAREKLLLAAGWKPGSPGLEKMKAQAWEKMTQGQRNRIAKALAVEPVQQRQPEGTPVNDMPSKAPGERWTTDRGAMPGEPFAYLDGDAETGVAAMREVENPGRGTSHYEVHDTAGSLLASGDTEAEAARLAEKRVDAKPATAPAKTKGEPHAQDADSAGRDGGVQPATAPAAAADTAVRQGELSKPEATGQTEKRAPKPRMGETADALWAAIKKDSTGVVYEGRIIVPTLRVVGGDDFKLNAKGELEVVDRKSGGIGVRDATEAEANEFHRDLDGDRVQVLLMSAPGYGSGYRAQKVLKELHSPSGLSFEGKTSTKAPAEPTKDQPHAAEQVPEPSGVRAEPENGDRSGQAAEAGAGDRVQRAEGSEEGKTAPAAGSGERDGGVAAKPREPVAADRTAPKSGSIQDAGEKIGGARKDKWKERGLDVADLNEMSDTEGAELAVKKNVWTPDYEAIAKDAEPVTAAMVKVVYDSLAAKPKKDTPQGRRDYVKAMQAVRKVYGAVKTVEEAKNAYLKLREELGVAKRPGLTSDQYEEGRRVLFSVYKGRSDPFVFDHNALSRARSLVKDGFPNIEPWKRRLVVRGFDGTHATPNAVRAHMEQAAALGTPMTEQQLHGTFWRVTDLKGNAQGYFTSKEDAEAAARTIYERDMKGAKGEKQEPQRPHLDELKREGLPQRIDRDVTQDDLIKHFGFRGVEFGNWSAQDERQRILNMAYDGLSDLAEIMGVPPKAMSLNGTLGMAFGARGGGRFAAHYEPGKLVINMTKLRGGGSMAHEWAHALDHYLGELEQPDAYKGRARGASGWYEEGQYNGVPIRRMERQADGSYKRVEGARLANLRPELAAAVDRVMSSIFQSQVTKEEMLRDLRTQLANTEANAAKETDPQLKAMYERAVENQRSNIAEVEKEPEDKTFPRGRSEYFKEAQKLSGKSEKGYWTRPTEMFARAFESWVHDRIVAMGASSDYLVHGVEADRFAGGGYKGNPYPVGKERAMVDAAFDNLVKTIQTKETDKGVAMFARKEEGSAGSMSTEQLQYLADAISMKWANAPEIVVVPDMEDPRVPPEARDDDSTQQSQGAAGRPAGFFYGPENKVFLVASEIHSPLEAITVLAHESLGHFGLRGFFGDAGLVPILQQIAAMRRKEVLAKAEAYGLDPTKKGDLLQAAEEVLAEMAQSTPQLGFVKRAIAAIRTWLRKHVPGFKNLALTDDEIVRSFILPARGWVVRGGAAAASSGRTAFSRVEKAPAGTNPSTAQPLHREIMQAMNDTFNAPGKLNWWHKSIGTQYNLAQRSPEYKRVFDSVQDFINDVSLYATEAADLAPKILPKLDTFKDIGKKPIAAADNKAISAPIFEGTLAWTRDEKGRPVKVDDAEKAASSMSADDKARELLRRGLLPENVLKMWQGRPLDEYRQAVATAYKNRVLKPGIVWSDDELRSVFKLTEPQIALYHEFRNAVDRSITAMAISDMVRYAGKDLTPEVRQEVLASPDVDAAALMLRDHLLKLAGEQADRNDVLTNAAETMIEKADRARELMDRGYAPLSRFGHYTVDVVDKNGERVYFGMFENAREAALMARKMRGNFPEATISRGTVSQEEYKLFAGVSPETVELFGELLGLEGQGDDPASKAFQTYIKVAKANRSAMKRLIERKGIAGFSEDVGRVLAGFIYSNARQTSQNLHMGEMTSAASDIPKGQGELKDQATKLVEYVKNPQEEAQGLRGLLFAQYLGGSVASAMVNMLQPVQVTLPYLSQYGGAAKAAASMAKAFADVRKKTTGDKALDAALKRAEEEGIVAPQEVFQLMAQARGRGVLKSGDGTAMGNARATASNAFSRLALAWGKIFGFAEQTNRRVTFIAAYRTAQREGIADPAKFAEKAVVETQFLYNKGNSPNWSRGAIGKTLFTFKSYSISYLELLHRMATQGGPEGKRAVLLALGMLFLFGGAGGLPFADDLDDLIDGVMQRLGYNFSSKLAKRQFFQKMLGRELGGMAEHGLSGLPGVPIDVSGRLGMGNLIPGTGFLVDKQDHTSDATEFLGAGGDFAKRLFSGSNKLLQGDFFGAAGDVAPRAAANAQKALEMYTTGQYKDANGRKVIDTDGFDALSKAIGFQPNDVAQVQQATGMQQQLIANVKLQTTRFADAWAKAVVDGDQDALQKVRQQVAQWNRDNPEAPISINRAQILSRVKAMREDKATRLQKTAPKAIRANVRQALAPEAAS